MYKISTFKHSFSRICSPKLGKIATTSFFSQLGNCCDICENICWICLCDKKTDEEGGIERQTRFICVSPKCVGRSVMILLLCVCVCGSWMQGVCWSFCVRDSVWVWLHQWNINSLRSFVTIRLYLNSINHESCLCHTRTHTHTHTHL